ncbi:MAG: fructose-1,6-bisphosphatase [Nitrosopumilus sp.]|nr:fructose-1,6-bisphosphatase [Nitrosopumilus sp.]
MKITVSVIKADVGGVGGHTKPSDGLIEAVRKTIKNSADLLIDYYIGYCGDDVHIVMSHTHGTDNQQIHKLAWDAFMEGTKVAKEEGLYGAGQDLLKDSFSGNVKGMGPGVAELEFEERQNEAFTVFAADKTEPGAFNYPIYRMFVDALSNTGLIVNESLASGVKINIMDVEEGKIAELELWQDKPTIEAALMYPSRYVVDSVTTKEGEPILAASTDRLHNIAGTYVGKDDPICLVRTQKNFPATEEVGSVFNNPHYVAGNTRGSHNMPLMPVKLNSAATINFCIPIVEALVFSMHNGKFTGPFDGFSTPDWDYIREIATKKAMSMRSQGFIHPATLVPSELEYAEGYKARMSILESKMKPMEGYTSKGEKKENYEDPD